MLGQLLAYDDNGNVIAALDHLVRRDSEGSVVGLVDFAASEANGVEMDGNVWHVDGAAGSKAWPQWVKDPLAYRVEREGPPGEKHISALVHRKTRRKRKRDQIEKEIAKRMEQATKEGVAADLRDLVGGPNRPVS